MNPRTETLAYRIWGDCRKHGWDRTLEEIGRSLALNPRLVRKVVGLKGWSDRLIRSDETTQQRGFAA